jgi:hypothetical protein
VPKITIVGGEQPFAGTNLDYRGYSMDIEGVVKYYEELFKLH